MSSSENAFERFEGELARQARAARSSVLRGVSVAGVKRVPAPGNPLGVAHVVGATDTEPVGPEAEIEAIKAEAREEGRAQGYFQGREDGRKEGYAAGCREGFEQAAAEMKSLVTALETMRTGLENSRASLLTALEREITALAFEIAGKLMLDELEINPDAMVATVKSVISRASEKRGLRVRLNPEDCAAIEERRRDLAESMADLGDFEIVNDSTLGRGDCVVETPSGTIDARLDRRLEKTARSVFGKDEAGA